MTTIWKFPLMLADRQVISAPRPWKPLSVAFQPGVGLCLWAIVNPGEDVEKAEYEVYIRGTGHPGRIVGDFVGTVFDGSFVWHVFVGEERTP